MDILNYTLPQLAEALSQKKISAKELTAFYLDRIEKYDGKINAYLYLNAEKALKDAEKQDELRATGNASLGAGIPIALKDMILTKNMPTTAASKMLDGYIPPYSATVVENLENAGYVVLGKLNMDQFAMGSSGETSYYKKTVNPWDYSKVPGGSSSGSAAAAAAGLATASLGSDTGGSLRQPAGFCGVVGYKPTYGTVSRYGAIAYGSSLDQIGTMTNSVEDAAFIMDTVASYDPKDPTSVKDLNRTFSDTLNNEVKGLKIGVCKAFFEGLPDGINKAVSQAIDTYKSLGAEIVEVAMPHADLGIAAYQILGYAEASSNFARFDGIRYGHRAEVADLNELYSQSRSGGFCAEVKRRMIFGTYVLQKGQYKDIYIQAAKVRNLIRQDFVEAYKRCSILLLPTSANVAFDFGNKKLTPQQMQLNDLYTVNLNLYGSCGITMPCGFHDGLPVGVQLQGDMFADKHLLNVAHMFQKATDWHKKRPELTI